MKERDKQDYILDRNADFYKFIMNNKFISNWDIEISFYIALVKNQFEILRVIIRNPIKLDEIYFVDIEEIINYFPQNPSKYDINIILVYILVEEVLLIK